jgi:hypothetical protein
MATRIAGAVLGIATAVTFLANGDASAGQCRDPWVTQAVQQVTGHQPNGSGDNGECDYRRYGGGRWTTYDDLVSKVRVTFGMGAPHQSPYGNLNLVPKASDFTVSSMALGYRQGHGPARGSTVNYQGRQYQVVNVIAQGGGNLITDNGGGVIAQGGGNLQITLRLINHDGASIVINHGSNVQSQQYRNH